MDHFIKEVAAHRSDMSFTEQNRSQLQKILKGTYRSHNVPSNDFKGWGLAFAESRDQTGVVRLLCLFTSIFVHLRYLS